jgi:hypothetical protein
MKHGAGRLLRTRRAASGLSVRDRLARFEQLYKEIAEPLASNFTCEQLNAWIARLDAHGAALAA